MTAEVEAAMRQARRATEAVAEARRLHAAVVTLVSEMMEKVTKTMVAMNFALEAAEGAAKTAETWARAAREAA